MGCRGAEAETGSPEPGKAVPESGKLHTSDRMSEVMQWVPPLDCPDPERPGKTLKAPTVESSVVVIVIGSSRRRIQETRKAPKLAKSWTQPLQDQPGCLPPPTSWSQLCLVDHQNGQRLVYIRQAIRPLDSRHSASGITSFAIKELPTNNHKNLLPSHNHQSCLDNNPKCLRNSSSSSFSISK